MRSIGLVVMSAALALVSAGCSNVNTQGQTTGSVTVTEVIPSSGPIAGNVPVQIKGTGFSASALSVKFGSNSMSNPQLIDAQTLHGTLPAAAAAGQVDVVVACGGKTATLPHGFTYTSSSSAITITGISPNNGPLGGGTQVTITGTGFQGGQTSVTFGSNAGSGVNVTTDSQLTVLTPPGAANGPVAVAVSNQHGTATLPNSFVYGNGGGGGGTVQTTPEHLGGLSELDKVADFTSGSESDSTEGFAYYFTPVDVLYPASGTCALDLDDGITSTIDAGTVAISQSSSNLALTKDTSSGTPVYKNTSGAATMFKLGKMAGISGSGSAALGAFNVASTAASPSADYVAWLDPLGAQKFSSGGFWSDSDLWIGWADDGGANGPGAVNNPVDHVQIVVEGQNIADGKMHVLTCDIRGATNDSGLFCVKGGYSNDLCQTAGSTMKDFYTAVGGPTLGFASSVVVIDRSNRASYALPNSSNAAMDVSILQATSLTMTGQQ